MTEFFIDWLTWITVAAIGAQVVTATAFLWATLPPWIILLAAVIFIFLGSELLSKFMPVDSHWSVYIARAVQVGLGVLIVVAQLP